MWSVFIPKEESNDVIYGFIAVCPLLCVCVCVCKSVIVRSSARVRVCAYERVRVRLTSENCVIIKNHVSDSDQFLDFLASCFSSFFLAVRLIYLFLFS